MTISTTKASILALALFIMPASAFAAQSAAQSPIVVAQATDTEAQDQGNGNREQVIRKFLANARDLSKLPADRLQQRLKRAKGFLQTPNLPSDLSSGLNQEIADLEAEIAKRQAAGTANSGGTAADSGDAQQQDGGQDQAASGGGQNQQAAPSGDIDAFLAGVKQPSELNDQQLRQQNQRAMRLMRSANVSAEQKQKLRQIAQQGRAEMASRKGGNGNASTDAGSGQSGAGNQQAQAPAAGAADVQSFLQSAKSPSDLDDKALRQQMREGMRLMKTQGLSDADKRKLRQIVQQSRAELQQRKGGAADAGNGAGDTGGTQTGQTQQQGTSSDQGQTAGSNAASETRARAFLDSKEDVSRMGKPELRKRLGEMRDLLASNQLSPATKKALRQQLANERAVLRGEVSQSGAVDQSNNTGTSQDGTVSGTNNTVNNTNVTVNNTTTNITNQTIIKQVIADRRPSRDLKDNELRRRINVYRDVVRDNRYSERDRADLRIILERDRVLLRERMLDERRRRQLVLKAGNSADINIDLELNFRPDRPVPPRSVFAAEVDDSELEDILSAPPRRKISRRYSVEEVETDPGLRDAVARIEIDTVRFGFGEGFLREEEIENLDRIGQIMEKILAVNPNEVFMIEGHTDAVGSDAANLQLSRERALAVKEALSTYYVIPPENLKTVGFGEKYLKIPTEEAEAENRRVSIARITPLVAGAN